MYIKKEIIQKKNSTKLMVAEEKHKTKTLFEK